MFPSHRQEQMHESPPSKGKLETAVTENPQSMDTVLSSNSDAYQLATAHKVSFLHWRGFPSENVGFSRGLGCVSLLLYCWNSDRPKAVHILALSSVQKQLGRADLNPGQPMKPKRPKALLCHFPSLAAYHTWSATTSGPRHDHASRIRPSSPLCSGEIGTRAAHDQLYRTRLER